MHLFKLGKRSNSTSSSQASHLDRSHEYLQSSTLTPSILLRLYETKYGLCTCDQLFRLHGTDHLIACSLATFRRRLTFIPHPVYEGIWNPRIFSITLQARNRIPVIGRLPVCFGMIQFFPASSVSLVICETYFSSSGLA